VFVWPVLLDDDRSRPGTLTPREDIFTFSLAVFCPEDSDDSTDDEPSG
jgi:hypothetical protein